MSAHEYHQTCAALNLHLWLPPGFCTYLSQMHCDYLIRGGRDKLHCVIEVLVYTSGIISPWYFERETEESCFVSFLINCLVMSLAGVTFFVCACTRTHTTYHFTFNLCLCLYLQNCQTDWNSSFFYPDTSVELSSLVDNGCECFSWSNSKLSLFFPCFCIK